MPYNNIDGGGIMSNPDIESTESSKPADTNSSAGQQPVAEHEADSANENVLRHVSTTISARSVMKPPDSLLHEICFVSVVSMGQFLTLTGLALSVVTGELIGRSFENISAGERSWFAASYSLTVGTFILVAGRLGDLYGHKWMYVVGFAWYGLWSLLAGFGVYPKTPAFFITCRAFQGVGAGLILPNCLAILGQTYPPGRRKELVFSIFGAMAPAGFIVAGIFAALVSERVWWPWSYWIMAILCFFLATVGLFVIPKEKFVDRMHDSMLDQNRFKFITLIDIPGAVTSISGLVLINFSWNQAPIVGWTDPYTYILLIAGFLCLGAFVFVERKAKYPLVPTSIFTSDVAWTLSCVACGWASFSIALYYVYQFNILLKGDSPLLAVAKWSGAPVTGIIAGLTTAYLLSRVPPSAIMVMALSGFLIGSTLLSTLPVNETYWPQMFVLTLLYPFGMDMSFPAATILLSNSMPHEHQGLAASLVATAVNYSISISLGFAGTIETQLNDGGKDILKGYRAALYLSNGLASLGMLLSLVYFAATWIRSRRNRGAEKEECV
ncbi:Drug resistance protein [Trichoderma lentiforme]|uniref:Drug resistance protein n=1 Tax=Trichoderma lentiforme TaxID=1567552 RepID=A0A9P4X6W9_9HYPO|nr:Drug resistance protein [Trichoderma lentiforme]